jgi:catechol 2,3-dioxygenase-like lactoylglutathione lyase family enzyme
VIRLQCCFRTTVLLLSVALLPIISSAQSGNNDLGIIRVRYVTIVVRDYDEALNWYTNVLGLEKVEAGAFAPGATSSDPLRVGKAAPNKNWKRWIVVAPRGRRDVGIILELAKPFAPGDSIHNYKARVGKETRWVFEVEDCRRFYELASKRGVKFVENPVDQAWGVTEAMFEDLYGNVFVIQSLRRQAATTGK